ncbi:hypothetical protein ACFRAQ_15595 [Nocardia sp. NPDC056611]|uniref:hypothetical protein n=1 Tax=Nocardia sp. NPDC056611 TaxID=3345877 RepID=UPI00366EFA49
MPLVGSDCQDAQVGANWHWWEVSPVMDVTMNLLSEIRCRYGSLDEFLARLHRALDEHTIELPVMRDTGAATGGRHRMRARV